MLKASVDEHQEARGTGGIKLGWKAEGMKVESNCFLGVLWLDSPCQFFPGHVHDEDS